jgi:hypothetical protein
MESRSFYQMIAQTAVIDIYLENEAKGIIGFYTNKPSIMGMAGNNPVLSEHHLREGVLTGLTAHLLSIDKGTGDFPGIQETISHLRNKPLLSAQLFDMICRDPTLMEPLDGGHVDIEQGMLDISELSCALAEDFFDYIHDKYMRFERGYWQ